LLFELAQAYFHSNKEKAKRYSTEAFNLAKKIKDNRAIARSANLLADTLRMEGKIEQAIKFAEIGLEFSQQAKDKKIEAESLNNLGLILWHKGEFDQAIKYFKECLELSEVLNVELLKSRAFVNLSLLYWEKGDLNLAMEYQKKGLKIKERIGDSFGIGISQLNLGLIYGDLGDWEKAIECYYRALVEMEKRKDLTDIALCYNNLGEIYLRRGKLEKSKELFERAIKTADLAPSPWVKAEALGNQGENYFRRGDLVRAIDCYNQDIKLSTKRDDKEELAETYRRMAELLIISGAKEKAKKFLDQGLELIHLTGAKKEEGNIYRVLGNFYSESNDISGAKNSFQKGLEVLKQFGNNYELGKLYLDYGIAFASYGDKDIAITYLNEAKNIFQRLGAAYELETVESYLAKIGIEENRAQIILKELSSLATQSNSFTGFGREVINLLKNRMFIEKGAFIIYRGGTFITGEISSEELESLCQKQKIQITPLTIICPVTVGGAVIGMLGMKWQEMDKAITDQSFLETTGNILALGIERLASQKIVKRGKEIVSTTYPMMIGEETTLNEIFSTIKKAAPTKVSVLIQGESGTGKELIARTIHRLSDRSENPFLPINCAAIPETLLESELFGIEKGTATGVTQRKGKIEQAVGGTIFLDEIGDMSLALQAKILRLLQEKQLEKVGGRKVIDVDIRIIAATNRDLENTIAAGKFREDLFYRLNVVTIHLPSLRERKEDIPELIGYFVDKYCREYKRSLKGVTGEVLARFIEYSWPGNVRELENVIERAVVLARGDQISLVDLPAIFHRTSEEILDYRRVKVQTKSQTQILEKEFLCQTLNKHNWNITRTAQDLNITRRHLYRLLKKYKIERALS
jgi:DNA-binding NtrC family response regulator/tetratricopeptide (TPR) repeat protein